MSENEKQDPEIANRVRMAREHLGLTQIQFADKLGISNSMISQIEKGERVFSIAVLIKISEVFNLSPSWLILGKGPYHLDELKDQSGPPKRDPELEKLVDICSKSPLVKHAVLGQFMLFLRRNKNSIKEDIEIERSERKGDPFTMNKEDS